MGSFVQPGKTHTDSARTTVEQLVRVQARLLGVVLNRIPRNRAYYYGGYRHYSPYYYYSNKHRYSAYGAGSESREEAESGKEASNPASPSNPGQTPNKE
jgi:Mrp family chromosome partitioning ATPase